MNHQSFRAGCANPTLAGVARYSGFPKGGATALHNDWAEEAADDRGAAVHDPPCIILCDAKARNLAEHPRSIGIGFWPKKGEGGGLGPTFR